MTPRLRLLGAECRAEAVHFAECERARFHVELSALSQVRLALAEVIELEEVGGSLARSRGQNRRVEQDEAALVKKIARGGFHFAAHAQDRVLARGADP